MALSKERTLELCAKFGKNEKDTGNVNVQIAICTERIKDLTEHMQNFGHDACAQRHLKMIVGQRGRLLRYLKSRDLEGYRTLIKELGIRK